MVNAGHGRPVDEPGTMKAQLCPVATLTMIASPPTRSPVAVPGPTGRRPWSTILLREWAAMKYPGVRLWEQVRLGPTSVQLVNVHIDPALENAIRVENWYADGILM